MDQDILNSSDGNRTDGENSAPAAAIAAAPLLLAEAVFSLKDIAEHDPASGMAADHGAVLERVTSLAAGFDGEAASGVSRALLQVPADLHQPLLGIFRDAMDHVSSRKNIPADPELHAALVDAIIQCLEPAKLCGIVRAEPGPIRLMVNLIDFTLDIFAAMQFMRTLWQLRGFEDIDLYSFWQPAQKWVLDRAANDIGRHRYWWPTVLEMIVGYYRPQIPDRLSVRYPEGQAPRAIWQLDRSAFDTTAKIGPQRTPLFLLPRMSTCPCPPEKNYTPDGKFISKSANEVVTIWYPNGLIHRDPKEGPAFHSVESHREVTKYMVDGQMHRDPEDGPAWSDTNRDGLHIEEFYWDGQIHRPAEQGPAMQHHDRGGETVIEIYAEHGQRHRVGGRAYLRIDADGTRMEAWYLRGNSHRDPKIGPASIQEGPAGNFIAYALDGEPHRDFRDGPAIIDADYEEKGILSVEYYAHGKCHRPSDEGPAVFRTDKNGHIVQESYHEHGNCHRDPAKGPAWAGIEDGERIEAYRVHGELHRPEHEGPAETRSDPETGRVTRQLYYLDGKAHRIDGPAYIEYHSDGSLFMETWYRHDLCHRDPLEGPSSILNSEFSGETYEEYFVDGVPHRNPKHGPACLTRNRDDVIITEGYLVEGKRHRADGPAVLYRDAATGEIERCEFWLNGDPVEALPSEETP